MADFGLMQEVYEERIYTEDQELVINLPYKWMALETLAEGVFSEKTDVVKLMSILSGPGEDSIHS